VPDSSLGTAGPDHQAVSPRCLQDKTCHPCKKEGNIVLSLFKVVDGLAQLLLRIT